MRALVLVAVLVACSKAGEPDKAAPVATPRDAVVAAWTSAKLVPSKLVAAPVAFAKDCQSGTVEGLDGRGPATGSAAEGPRGSIDVLLCNFATPADAKAAEEPGLAWVGLATGASQAHGAALIVLVDKKKADPSGRTINRLMKLAPN
jgi:hypothetical protein